MTTKEMSETERVMKLNNAKEELRSCIRMGQFPILLGHTLEAQRLCREMAEELKRPYFENIPAICDSIQDAYGFLCPDGHYCSPALIKACEEGGLYFVSDVELGNPDNTAKVLHRLIDRREYGRGVNLIPRPDAVSFDEIFDENYDVTIEWKPANERFILIASSRDIGSVETGLRKRATTIDISGIYGRL